MQKNIKLTTLSALFIINAAFAQKDTMNAKRLEEVVVTGQYRPRSIKNSVYQVRVINNEQIRLSGATSTQQVLNTQLGFRLSNDNTLGTTDVQLMGMSGRNVKILLDAVPMIDRGDTRESLGQIDINTIDRIEIIEGPMSVSYGSDALAGVINIITKKHSKDNFSIIAKIQEETAGNEYYPFSYKGVHIQNIGINFNKKEWSASIAGTHNDADGFGGDIYGRGKTWRPKEQWLGNIKLGYANSKFNVYYRLDGLNEGISNRNPINLRNYRAVDQEFTSKRFMHQVQGQVFFNKDIQLSTIVSYTNYQRKTTTTVHDLEKNTTELTSGQGEQDLSKFNSFVFRNTLQYRISDKLSLQPGIDINREEASGARIVGNPVITDHAAFVSAEIKPTSRINIRPGLRFIKNSVYDAPPVVPSINTKFVLNNEMDLRVAYAYGFRSPALRELYFSFIDANHSIFGNPDLKAEYSNSFNAYFNWALIHTDDLVLSSTFGSFYNEFKDLINYATDPNDPSRTITVNIDKFKTTGATWENKANWKNISVSIGFSYIGRYNYLSDDATYKNEGVPTFAWTPEINSNIIYTAKKIGTSFALFYKYTGKRPGYELDPINTGKVRLTKIGSFSWADLTISKPLYKYFIVNTGIKNIFDVTNLSNTASNTGGAHGGGGIVQMGYGRSYFLSLTFQWSKK